jgi:transcriptional regulator with XRE-family HTH domain
MKGHRGRRRPPDAEVLLSEVKKRFKEEKDRLGSVKDAAKELGVKPSSFYKYLKGQTLPDMDVLRRASECWKIKWPYMDFSELMPTREVRTSKQLVFSFLQLLRADDIEVVKVGPKNQNILQVTLNIRFSA